MPSDRPNNGVGGVTGDGPVLVVHGDAAARALIADALRLEGFRAVSGSHGDALTALEAQLHEPPRAVLLDLDGRDAQGGGVSAFASALAHRHGDVPIIALTTSPNTRDGSAVGAATLVPEPFDLDLLIDVVSRCCRN